MMAEARLWLTEQNQIWRESLLVNCSFAKLLEENWEAAVEYFLNHVASLDQLGHLYNSSQAHGYFTRFCRNHTTSAELIRHLHSLHSEASGPATTAGLEEICETKATVISNVNERPE